MTAFSADHLRHTYDEDATPAGPDRFNPDSREDVIAMMESLEDEDPFRSKAEIEHVEDVMHDELDAEPSDRDHVRTYLARQRELHRALN